MPSLLKIYISGGPSFARSGLHISAVKRAPGPRPLHAAHTHSQPTLPPPLVLPHLQVAARVRGCLETALPLAQLPREEDVAAAHAAAAEAARYTDTVPVSWDVCV